MVLQLKEAFKDTWKSAWSENAVSDSHKSQITAVRTCLVLAEGKAPPAEPGKIVGYFTPIDPYSELVIMRRINTAHKVAKRNQSIISYMDDIIFAEEEWS